MSKARRGNATDDAYGAIRRAILLGEFSPGQALKESRLTRLYQLGRTPIRQALARLEAEGLVSIDAEDGPGVRRTDPPQLRALFGLRFAVENLIAWELARQPGEELQARLSPLQHILEQTGELIRQSPSDDQRLQLIELDVAFHTGLAKAGAYEPAAEFLREALYRIVIAIPSIRDPKRTREVYEEHQEIVAAVSARDVDRARRAIGGHLIGATLRWFPWLQPFLQDDLNDFFRTVASDLSRRRKGDKQSDQ